MVKKVMIEHPGSLEGYHIDEPATKRRAALKKADRKYGSGKVDQKLDALHRFNSHRPANRKVVRSDLKWNERQAAKKGMTGGERRVWVPGHYSNGRWVRGHYMRVTAHDRAVDRRNLKEGRRGR
jgi:hypothetical protein